MDTRAQLLIARDILTIKSFKSRGKRTDDYSPAFMYSCSGVFALSDTNLIYLKTDNYEPSDDFTYIK